VIFSPGLASIDVTLYFIASVAVMATTRGAWAWTAAAAPSVSTTAAHPEISER